MEYLDFELPLKELKDQLEKCNEIGDESKVDVRDTSRKLKEKIEAKKKGNLFKHYTMAKSSIIKTSIQTLYT